MRMMQSRLRRLDMIGLMTVVVVVVVASSVMIFLEIDCSDAIDVDFLDLPRFFFDPLLTAFTSSTALLPFIVVESAVLTESSITATCFVAKNTGSTTTNKITAATIL